MRHLITDFDAGPKFSETSNENTSSPGSTALNIRVAPTQELDSDLLGCISSVIGLIRRTSDQLVQSRKQKLEDRPVRLSVAEDQIDRWRISLQRAGRLVQTQGESSVVSRYPSAENAVVKFPARQYQPNRPNPNYRIVWPSNHSAGSLGRGLN
jgi:hypothetical protein